MNFASATLTLFVVCIWGIYAQNVGNIGGQGMLGRLGMPNGLSILRDFPYPERRFPWERFPSLPPLRTPERPFLDQTLGTFKIPDFTTPAPVTDNPTPVSALPGGVNEVPVITQEHKELAAFAASEIGSEYTVTQLKKVQSQVVAGLMYHMTMVISKTNDLVKTSFECDVKVYHIVWLSSKTLEEFKCKRLFNV